MSEKPCTNCGSVIFYDGDHCSHCHRKRAPIRSEAAESVPAESGWHVRECRGHWHVCINDEFDLKGEYATEAEALAGLEHYRAACPKCGELPRDDEAFHLCAPFTDRTPAQDQDGFTLRIFGNHLPEDAPNELRVTAAELMEIYEWAAETGRASVRLADLKSRIAAHTELQSEQDGDAQIAELLKCFGALAYSAGFEFGSDRASAEADEFWKQAKVAKQRIFAAIAARLRSLPVVKSEPEAWLVEETDEAGNVEERSLWISEERANRYASELRYGRYAGRVVPLSRVQPIANNDEGAT